MVDIEKGVLIDSNILVAMFEERVDIFERVENYLKYPVKFYTTTDVLSEVGKRIKVKTLKKYLEKKGVTIIETQYPGKTDDKLVKIAKERNLLILTRDNKLQRKALSLGVGVLTLTRDKRIIYLPPRYWGDRYVQDSDSER